MKPLSVDTQAPRLSDEALAKVLRANQSQADHLFRYPPGTTLEPRRGVLPPRSLGRIERPALLYAHVPFCHSICKFCNIYKELYPGGAATAAYLKALLREARAAGRLVKGAPFVSAYLGGGTPTILSAPQLDALLGGLRAAFRLGPEVAFEVDATPSSLTAEKVAVLRRHGVRYLTMGIQTLEEKALWLSGRRGQNAKISRLPALLTGSGFQVHFDFIVGLPGDTVSGLRAAIDAVARDFSPASLSVNTYDHTRDTLFAREGGGVDFESPARTRKVRFAAKALEAYVWRRHGLKRGPRHYFPNVAAGAAVLGLGAGAYGYIPGAAAYRNLPYPEYMKAQASGLRKLRVLSREEDQRSFIIHNLMSATLFADYRARFAADLARDFPGPCAELTLKSGGFAFRDRDAARAAEVRFYSPDTLACYGL